MKCDHRSIKQLSIKNAVLIIVGKRFSLQSKQKGNHKDIFI